MMKKNYSFILFAILFISNAFGLIANLNSQTKVTNNFNKTGVILYNEYDSDLEIGSNIIKTYSYIDLTSKDSPKIDTNNLELNNSLENLEPNSISILIPRKTEYTKEISIQAYEDVLLRMYNTVNLQNTKLNLQPTSEPFLNAIESYLVANTLENSFDTQKKAKLAGAILGSHALFMPQNKSTINKFNGVGRVLSTPITYINDLLLEKNDFTNNETITEKQIASLQNLIFQEMQKAKTVVFIPECMSNKLSDNQTSRSIRLPLAIINKIDLNPEDNTINIEFLTSKTAENNFGGYYNFLNARQSFFQDEANTDNQWEFINYTFKIGFNNTNTFNKCYKNPSIYYYQVSNINIEPNGIVNTQQLNDTTNNRPPQDRLTSTEYLLNSDLTKINCYNDIQEQNRLSQATLPSGEDLQNIDSSYEQQIKDYYEKNGSPCNHYKRKCLVKIEDDDKFYPCHGCYNIEKVITDRKLMKKSKNATALKCLECGHKQLFDQATGSNCLNCDTKFAEYYCGFCKHLTGTDNHPYHCEKCGICRMHNDKSYHCDICGICIGVKLRNNHKCRAGSAHDECCICLEDAFLGCQILHCSHKVHKECAIEMIKNGITCCPICRESFAHKLEQSHLYR